MNLVNGHPVVYWTVKRVFDNYGDARVTLIAPEFDRQGSLDSLRQFFEPDRFAIFYGHDASPLKRMIAATEGCDPEDQVVRVDGLHMWFDVDAVQAMYSQSCAQDLDGMKFPDDFPAQFTAEVYSVRGLRGICEYLHKMPVEEQGKHSIHPKFLLMRLPEFKTAYLVALPEYSAAFLRQFREIAAHIYSCPRLEVTGRRIAAGDQILYHYELASDYLETSDAVLDIASGEGRGGAIVAAKVRTVTCADIDESILTQGQSLLKDVTNLKFSRQDVTHMDFADGSFDAVLSMETIEHIPNDVACCREIARVLRADGRFILSTPQNSMGQIPVNTEHVREYDVKRIESLLSPYFNIKKIIGLKSGTIHFDDDNKGSNMLVVASKRRRGERSE